MKRLRNSEKLDIFDLSCCRLCPRECGVDRGRGELGFCGEPAVLYAARAAKLYYEEPCISGSKGSGAIFFEGCNLGCVFCQNDAISHGMRKVAPANGFSSNVEFSATEEAGNRHTVNGTDDSLVKNAQDKRKKKNKPENVCESAHSKSMHGKAITPARLAAIMLELQAQGCANINLVTASHYLPLVIPALKTAKAQGLTIPVVYNTASYEKAEALRQLEGLVDIYLPDLKYKDPAIASAYSQAPDYYDVAWQAIEEMVRQCPEPVFADGSHELDEADDKDDPLMTRGVIVRHLCMPGHTEDSKAILLDLYQRYHNQIFISIMNQYTPMPRTAADPLLSRALREEEYSAVVQYAIEIGVENGFLQEGGTVSKSFIPAWDGTGI